MVTEVNHTFYRATPCYRGICRRHVSVSIVTSRCST